MHKGFKCLDISTDRIYISCDGVFDEGCFPFVDLHPNAGAQLKKDIVLLPSHLLSARGIGCTCPVFTNPTNKPSSSGDVQDFSGENLVQNHEGEYAAESSQLNIEMAADDPSTGSRMDPLPPGTSFGADAPANPPAVPTIVASPVGASPGAMRGGISSHSRSPPTAAPESPLPANPTSPRGELSPTAPPTAPTLSPDDLGGSSSEDLLR